MLLSNVIKKTTPKRVAVKRRNMRVKCITLYRSLVLSDTFRHVVQTAIMLG
jgi:hypothetical protein